VGRPVFYGVITPFITPFREDLSLDLEAARWLARLQVERGVHGIFPNSTTGSSYTSEPMKLLRLLRPCLSRLGAGSGLYRGSARIALSTQ